MWFSLNTIDKNNYNNMKIVNGSWKKNVYCNNHVLTWYIIEHHDQVLKMVQVENSDRIILLENSISDNRVLQTLCYRYNFPYPFDITKYRVQIRTKGLSNTHLIFDDGTKIFCFFKGYINHNDMKRNKK